MNIILDILSNKKIVDLIDSKESGYEPQDPQTLIYRNIFPFLKVPDVQTNAMTNILIAVDKLGKHKTNPSYSNVRVTIWVLAHQEHMRMKNKAGSRIDVISDEIEKLFRGSKKYGFSELDDFPNYEKLLSEKFIYREIVFRTSELSKPVCGIGW